MGRQTTDAVMALHDRNYLVPLGNAWVDRDSPPMEAYGSIHELNCWIGVITAMTISASIKQTLNFVQHDLRYLCDQISIPEKPLLSLEHISRLDAAIGCMASESGALGEEISLPGGVQSAAFSHVAHAVCLRAERRLSSLTQQDGVVQGIHDCKERKVSMDFGLTYLHRLSDLLLLIAREENRQIRDPA